MEVVYVLNLRYLIGYGYPPGSFCALDVSQIITKYYTSQSDAENDISPVNDLYAFSVNTEIYSNVTNTLNSDSHLSQFRIHIENYTSSNIDNDGIEDVDEDANRNGSYLDGNID